MLPQRQFCRVQSLRVAADVWIVPGFVGLTIVVLSNSLPELASSIAAVRKGEHDIAIGSVVGPCMFNLLAGAIASMEALSADIMLRDWPVMMA